MLYGRRGRDIYPNGDKVLQNRLTSVGGSHINHVCEGAEYSSRVRRSVIGCGSPSAFPFACHSQSI
jgi:hypothetical protein